MSSKLIIFLIVSCTGLKAFGAILNPVLPDNDQMTFSTVSPFQGSIQSQLSRKLIINAEPFNIQQEDNLLDLLYIYTDINIKYSFRTIFPKVDSDFFSQSAFFLFLRYERPIYSGEESINTLCWMKVICFGNGMVGIRGPLFNKNDLLVKLSMYAKLPFSKLSLKQSFLMGAGMLVETTYSLLSTVGWKILVTSGHSVELDAYIYRTVNIKGTSYNRPLEVWNQIGFQLLHNQYKWFPKLFFYGDYQVSMNFNSVFYHNVSLNQFLSWSIARKFQLLLGLSWGDRILDLYNITSPVEGKVFNLNKVFAHLGGSYVF